jgi:protein tyrosine phosphatase (PTP) superfamily phosphohydrolase (DUF442 family)
MSQRPINPELSPESPKRVSRRILILTGVVAALVIVAGFLLHTRQAFRLAEVISGEVYRSSQPSPSDLAALVRDLGLRHVLNVRGYREGESWHRAETAACDELGVGHTDVRVRIHDWVAQHEARRFVTLLEETPKPLLIHCKNGADRAGWGAAVAVLLAGASLEEGLRELSPAHGHFCNRSRCHLHDFFTYYRDFLASQQLVHAPDVFRRWIMEEYYPGPYKAELELLDQPRPGLLHPGEPLAFTVRVVNQSREDWPMSPGSRGIRLGVRVLGPFRELPDDPIAIFRTPNNPARDLVRDGLEDGVMESGATRVFHLQFPAPGTPGAYVLQIHMVDERVHWFSDLGDPGLLVELRVETS